MAVANVKNNKLRHSVNEWSGCWLVNIPGQDKWTDKRSSLDKLEYNAVLLGVAIIKTGSSCR